MRERLSGMFRRSSSRQNSTETLDSVRRPVAVSITTIENGVNRQTPVANATVTSPGSTPSTPKSKRTVNKPPPSASTPNTQRKPKK